MHLTRTLPVSLQYATAVLQRSGATKNTHIKQSQTIQGALLQARCIFSHVYILHCCEELYSVERTATTDL